MTLPEKDLPEKDLPETDMLDFSRLNADMPGSKRWTSK
jgi:hypothetical protein